MLISYIVSILCLPRWFNNSINFKTYIEPAQPVHQSPATPPATAPAGPASSPAVAAFTKGATSFPPHNFPAAAPGGTLLTCVDSWCFWGIHTQVILGQILATQFLGIWNQYEAENFVVASHLYQYGSKHIKTQMPWWTSNCPANLPIELWCLVPKNIRESNTNWGSSLPTCHWPQWLPLWLLGRHRLPAPKTSPRGFRSVARVWSH